MKSEVDLRRSRGESLPRHIAFIMDGNGRWARHQGLLRLRGHEEGASSLRRLTRRCRSLGIGECTFYALSTENFQRRPRGEVRFLLRLLKKYLIEERSELLENGIRLKAIGRIEAFPADVRAELAETERLTADLDGMVLRLALNYGARQEIVDAVNRLVALHGGAQGEDAGARAEVSEETLRQFFYDPTMSDPDLLIRTAGETRLSNFLLWQASYSEIWVTETLWPDFNVEGLDQALAHFQSRVRKFGAVVAQDAGPANEQAEAAAGAVDQEEGEGLSLEASALGAPPPEGRSREAPGRE